MATILRVFGYLKRYPFLAGTQFLFAILATLLLIVFPNIVAHIIDEVIPSRDLNRLWPAVGLALGAFFAREVFDCLRILLNNTFEQKVIFDLRSDLYAKIQRLPVRWFDRRHSGDIMTRVAEDVTAMERVLIDGIEQGGVAVLQLLVVAAAMFLYDPQLAAITLIPLPFLALGAILYTRKARDRHREVRRATSEMNALVVDNVSGIRQIKAYAIEPQEHRRFNRASEALRQATLGVMRMWALYKPGMSFLSSLGLVLVLAFGGAAAIRGEIKPGELTAFLLFLGFFYEPVNRLHQLNQMLLAGRAAAERVFEIIDDEDEPGLAHRPPESGSATPATGEADSPATTASLALRGSIRFRDLTFSYGEGIPAIRGVDLEIAPGQTIALVGSTGAGKSTLINLLTRFYEFDGGEIEIDGKPIRDYPKPALRAAMGYVTQESFLFNGTVRENLEIARSGAGDAELWEVLNAANAEHFVRAMPEGLDTQVGERGVRLSVGEKQRISIARALLKNPPILLLDEATASVDTETERLIQQALERLMENRTSIVIAHRLSTVRNADRIYVIEDGAVTESGDHDSLMAKNGTYARLCENSHLD